MKIDEVLQDREKTHGDFEKGAEIFDQLMELVEANRKKFTKSQRYGLTHIMGKLTRIIGGNANEIDHWRDVAGYATLVAKSLEKAQEGELKVDNEKLDCVPCNCSPVVVNKNTFQWGEG